MHVGGLASFWGRLRRSWGDFEQFRDENPHVSRYAFITDSIAFHLHQISLFGLILQHSELAEEVGSGGSKVLAVMEYQEVSS